MHSSRRQRYREVVDDISETLIGISLEPHLMPAAATLTPTEINNNSNNDIDVDIDVDIDADMLAVHSSASTPSLRSKDGTLPPLARMDNGGNVRVVVRVRAFLPRGGFDC